MNKIADQIRKWRDKPSQMVRELFGVEPDPWQADVLDAFPHQQRIAMKSSKGPGKSTTEAWIAWNFLLTRPHPKIAATSISADNLSDGLWTEMAKWMAKAPLLQQTFTWTKTRIFANDHPETWWMAARSWSRTADRSQQADTLAGLHADYILFLIDESGGIPDSVMAAAEAALATGIETHIVQAGNPTALSGPLYRACTSERRLWHVVEITSDPDNPKRSPRVSIQWAKEQIEKYGRDNAWVLVNVLGQFPPSSLNALIGPDELNEATRRYYREHEIGQAPLVLGIDVARFGDDCFDDQTEILTNDGWKLFADLSGEERVLSLPKDQENASWEPIDLIHRYEFDGEMNLLEKSHLNFCVTDKHRFLVKSNPKSASFKFEEYRNLPQEFIVRERNGWSGTSPERIQFRSSVQMPHGGQRERAWDFSYLDWAEMLGWFVSEGNVYVERRRRGRLRTLIAQNPGPKQEEIKALLKRMGITSRVTPNQKQLEFSIWSVGEYLRLHCGVGAANKRVPEAIRNGSPEVIRAFLDAFRKGDGTQNKKGMGRTYVTSSKLLADDLQEMLAKLGHAGLVRLKERKGSTFTIAGRKIIRENDTYVIYEKISNFWGKTVDKRDVERVAYKGLIWCVSTRFQSIYVRRKGVPMWSGNSSVILPRRGIQCFPMRKLRNVDSTQGAGTVARIWTDTKADAAFIDDTGGFGSGWIDQLRLLGRTPIGVQFSAKAHNAARYANKRTEMYFDAVEWIKRGGALPADSAEIVSALSQTTYTFMGDKLILEPKDSIKAKIGHSPDEADALVLTFAEPVAAHQAIPTSKRHSFDYHPYAEPLDKAVQSSYDYSPYRDGR